MNDFLQQMKVMRMDTLSLVKHNFPLINAVLSKAGVAFVDITYDGSGDSGSIESVEYKNSKEEALDESEIRNLTVKIKRGHSSWQGGQFSTNVTEKEASMHDAIDQLAYDLLEIRHPGWEINEGSFGQFKWRVRLEQISHEHNERITDISTSVHESIDD